MPSPRRRPRWVRRLLVSVGALAVLVITACVVAWLCLPQLVTRGFLAGARAVGGERASIVVDRADLSGLRVRAVAFQLGGLSVDVPSASADYSIRSLLDGRAHEVTVEGLTAGLDFTRPRRGLLPDAIEDLMAQLSGEGELVWPLDTLTLRQCTLVLHLPGQAVTAGLSGLVRRRPDGFLDLEITITAPDTQLEVSGRIRTETMDGELRLDHLSLQPSTWLTVAAALGVAPLPASVSVESSRITASGTVSLRQGLPASFALRLDAPSLQVAHGSGTVRLGDLTVSAAESPEGTLRAELSCHVQAAAPDASWHLDETLLHLALADGGLRGHLATTAFSVQDTAGGRAGLEIECGVPALGGASRARAVLTVDGLIAEDRSWAPLSLQAEGWTDRIILSIPRIALAEHGALEAANLRIDFADPFGVARSVEASCDLVATSELSSALPPGWALALPRLPCTLGHLAAAATEPNDAGMPAAFSLKAQSTLDTLQFTRDGTVLTGRPVLTLEGRGDLRGASLAARLDLHSLSATTTTGWHVPESASLQVEIPRLTFTGVAAVLEGRAAEEPLGVKLSLSATGPDQALQASVGATRDPAQRGWNASLDADIRSGAASLAGVRTEGLEFHLAVDSGLLDDTAVARAIHEADTSGLLPFLAAGSRIDATCRATALDLPGGARFEWLDATLAKHPAAAPDTPVRAAFEARAGLLRAGPEVLEQPAVHLGYAGGLTEGALDTRVTALVEGSTLEFGSRHDLRFGAEEKGLSGSGSFVLQPLTLTNSDILSRWSPGLKGVVLSATIGAAGTVQSDATGSWDGTAQVHLTQGRVAYPAQDLHAEGLFADLDVESLKTGRTRPAQRVGFSRLTINDVVLSDGLLQFRAADASVIHVEAAGFRAFDGSVRAEPFSLYFPDPDVALDLSMKDLDAGALVRTFDLFNGSLTGRLQGRLPIGLLAGKPIIGEGFLELQPEHPARLNFDAGGLFTEGLANRTWLEKINRLPNELIEQGLANLQLRHFRVDLFRRDRPDRPIEILLGGVAHTSRADVPIELEVRLNGSMAEVIDLLMQLIML